MGNKFYAARDDGETWGPFESADEAIFHCIMQLADDPDAFDEFRSPATSLMEWHRNMVSHATTHSSMEYGMWLRAAKELIQRIDWIVYGVEFIVDSPVKDGQTPGILNFLASPEMLHDPATPEGVLG